MRVVLNTNVGVSALNFSGNERLALELALRGRFEFYLSRSYWKRLPECWCANSGGARSAQLKQSSS